MANKVRVAFVQRQSVADKDISALKIVPDLGLEVEAKRDRISKRSSSMFYMSRRGLRHRTLELL